MLATGALMAVQSEVNGRMAAELGTGLRAATSAALISFGGGLLILTVLALVRSTGRHGFGGLLADVRSGRLRPRDLPGGMLGAFVVMTQCISVPGIGVALFTVALTAGQSASGLVADHRGWGPSGRQPIAAPRVIGAVLAVTAVVLTAGERLVERPAWTILGLALLPFVGGFASSVQQALNGRLAVASGAGPTTLLNFVVGVATLTVCFAVSFLVPGELVGWPVHWWLYTGGVMAALFIWMMAVTVRMFGVLVLGLSLVAGQVIGSQVIELASARTHIGLVGIAAGVLTVTGVCIALLARRRTPDANGAVRSVGSQARQASRRIP